MGAAVAAAPRAVIVMPVTTALVLRVSVPVAVDELLNAPRVQVWVDPLVLVKVPPLT